MMSTPVLPAACLDGPTRKLFTGFFWAILGGAAVLALMILLLPNQVFLAISNYLQIIVAIGGSTVFLYAWHRCGGPESYLYLAGGFGIWGIANIAWYINVLMGQRAMVFPSLIDIGMIASFLVLSKAFKKGLARKQLAPGLLLGLLVICLIIPVGVMVTSGFSAATLVTLAYFLACGSFLIIGLNHSLGAHPEILAGAVLFALSFMIYPLRELFLVANPVFSIIGTFVSAGFALMAIGWLSVR